MEGSCVPLMRRAICVEAGSGVGVQIQEGGAAARRGSGLGSGRG